MADINPDAKLIGRQQVRAMLGGVDDRTIARWQQRANDPLPVASRGRPIQYDIGDVHKWGVRQRLADMTVADDGTVYDIDAERGRLTHHQANKTALEEQALAGVLIRADLVEQQWSAIAAGLRAHLLALPVRLAQVAVASGSELREVERAARDEIYGALAEMIDAGTQRIITDPADSGGEPGKAAPAAAPDGGGMGGLVSLSEPGGEQRGGQMA